MEIKARKIEPKYVEIELVGEDIAFADAIKEILLQYKDVEFAAARLEHPQIGNPVIMLRTKSKDAMQLLQDAVAKLKKDAEDFRSAFKSSKKTK